MRLSAKSEYAAIAVLELAASFGSGEPVQVRKIADEHGIPQRFLVQILLQLKGAGLVSSTRGASGGYQLAKVPHDITLWDIVKIIDGQANVITTNTPTSNPKTAILIASWQAACDAEQEQLQSVDFGQLAERVRNQADMYYI